MTLEDCVRAWLCVVVYFYDYPSHANQIFTYYYYSHKKSLYYIYIYMLETSFDHHLCLINILLDIWEINIQHAQNAREVLEMQLWSSRSAKCVRKGSLGNGYFILSFFPN